MKLHKWKDIKNRFFTEEEQAESQEWVRKELEQIQLRELREMAGLTQVQAAELLDASQSQLSALEKRTDHKVSTLKRYVEALGGELEITARFGDRALRLKV